MNWIIIFTALYYLILILNNFGKKSIIKIVLIFLFILTHLVTPILIDKYFSLRFEIDEDYLSKTFLILFSAIIIEFSLSKIFKHKNTQKKKNDNFLKLLTTSFYFFVIVTFLSIVFDYSNGIISIVDKMAFGIFLFKSSIENKADKKMLILLLLIMLLDIILNQMFTLFVWFIIIYLFTIYRTKKVNLFKSVIFFLLGIILIMGLHIFKKITREQVWNNHNSINIDVNDFTDYKDIALYLSLERINQSRHVQSTYDFAEKQSNHDLTIDEVLLASILPRAIWPNKPETGGSFTFTRLTGINLNENNSMNTGVLAESYWNFGLYGGTFMLVFFFFIANKIDLTSSSALVKLILYSSSYSIIRSFETDYLSVFNDLIKISIVFYTIYLIAKSYEQNKYYKSETF